MPALLTQERLESLHRLATSKSLDVVLEVTSELELQRALTAGAQIVCAVGRNLDTWEASWDQTVALVKKIPKNCLKMAEGGIRTLEQIKELEALGVHGAIIGDVLLDDFYPGKRLAQILAGVEPPKKSAKAKNKADSAATAAHATKTAPVAVVPSNPRKEGVPGSDKGTKPGQRPSRTTSLITAQKGVKEPQMAETRPMVPAAPAAMAPAAPKKKAAKKGGAKKKAAPKKKAAKKKATPKKKAAPKRKAAKKKAAPKRKAAKKKAAPKKKKAAKKGGAKKKAAPKKKAAKRSSKKKTSKK